MLLMAEQSIVDFF